MIRIKNQEEFKKCCEMCNSRDIESRYLGISLMNECVEHLNCTSLTVQVVHHPGDIDLYEWNKFIEIGIDAINYKFGNDLYDLILQGYRKSEFGLTMRLKYDKSDK